MDLDGGWECMEWIYLARFRDDWNVVVEKMAVLPFL